MVICAVRAADIHSQLTLHDLEKMKQQQEIKTMYITRVSHKNKRDINISFEGNRRTLKG